MGGDNHLSGTPVARRLKRHYPEGRRAALTLPYLVLLHVGFTQASQSPDCWCALTAPFHPYRSEIGGLNFYGTVPKVTLAGRYPAHCPVELGLSSPLRKEGRDCLGFSYQREDYTTYGVQVSKVTLALVRCRIKGILTNRNPFL